MGSTQIPGIVCVEVYSLVLKYFTVRLLFVVSLKRGWKRKRFDLKKSSVNAPLSEVIYVRQSEEVALKRQKDRM